ncbi:MAG: putative entry exclusion protein TrbK-alt [Erythrobacter sp.]|nr:putative entry exclusion protein TrbK-alt [Erythrobacter sp.]
MAVLELREEPAPPRGDVIAAAHEAGDDAKATLAYCAALGLEAASVGICTAAWAAERRRFLGQAERDAADASPVAENIGDAALDMAGDR